MALTFEFFHIFIFSFLPRTISNFPSLWLYLHVLPVLPLGPHSAALCLIFSNLFTNISTRSRFEFRISEPLHINTDNYIDYFITKMFITFFRLNLQFGIPKMNENRMILKVRHHSIILFKCNIFDHFCILNSRIRYANP